MATFDKIKSKLALQKHILYLLFSHTILFTTILSLALLYFKGNLISTIWAYAGNDSWNFVQNTIQIQNPPYPFHLITTSIHYYPMYFVLSSIIPKPIALSISILSIQYIFSLGTILLLYYTFKDLFPIADLSLLAMLWIIDTTIFATYFLLAMAEILFIFYQTLAWYLFIKKHYIFSFLALGMTAALRFNGYFFIGGFFVTILYYIYKNKDQLNYDVLKAILYFPLCVITSIIPFVYSLVVAHDFFLPITSEYKSYSTWEAYIPDGHVIQIPFTYWPHYIAWVFTINSNEEYILLIIAIISFSLGFLSIIYLFWYGKRDNSDQKVNIKFLTILIIINFLGVNTVVSGRNYGRFFSFTFPIYPILMYLGLKLKFTNIKLLLFISLFFVIGILLNFLSFINVSYCENCQHYF